MTRSDYIHCARVCLAEARRRRMYPQSRDDRWFVHTLLAWAASDRRKAQRQPWQREMFG
jgi:hypothetical protein